jgi:hypothetical protein
VVGILYHFPQGPAVRPYFFLCLGHIDRFELFPGKPLVTATDSSYEATTETVRSLDAGKAKAAGIAALVMKPLTKGEPAQTVQKVLDMQNPTIPRRKFLAVIVTFHTCDVQSLSR